MGGDVWAEFAGAEGVAYLTGVFGFLAEEGNLTVGDDGAVRDVLAGLLPEPAVPQGVPPVR